jgi:hypothetical protein
MTQINEDLLTILSAKISEICENYKVYLNLAVNNIYFIYTPEKVKFADNIIKLKNNE